MSTYRAPEAHLVPFAVQRDDGFVGDGFAAALATVGVFGQVAFLTVWGACEFHELCTDQLAFAVGADEVVFVPVSPHGLDAFL